ncbi:MAG: glycerol-3-phosphate dehydrogenase [Actinomycetaceae bacterium]|nr:glycerol-3-phosphate dehydrogenase [Actinomycetaceae bacterium]
MIGRITILGASAMGSALCTPMVQAGWEVRLWGTQFDDGLIDLYMRGEPHPMTSVAVSREVKLYRSAQLKEAMRGADVAVISVASGGVPAITELVLPYMSKLDSLWLTAKGFWETPEGHVELLPETMRRIAAKARVTMPPIVSVGGPVIAKECARGKPTATVFGCHDLDIANKYARTASTEAYRIEVTSDEIGLDIYSALKNAYAIALGIADGRGELTAFPEQNLRAAIFVQAIRELGRIGEALGAHPDSIYTLAGIGDLEVTGTSGRNKFYGMRIGRGEDPERALEQMQGLGQTVEGVRATELGVRLLKQRVPDLLEQLPLLRAINKTLFEGGRDAYGDIVKASLPTLPHGPAPRTEATSSSSRAEAGRSGLLKRIVSKLFGGGHSA